MSDEERPVREIIEEAIALFREHGQEPTRCQLSLALARRAAREHEAWRGPMFQSWHPTMEFIVELALPPDTQCVMSAPPRDV